MQDSKFTNISVDLVQIEILSGGCSDSMHKLSRNVAMHHVTKHAKDATVTKVLQNCTPKETIWTWISTRMITQLDSQIGETLVARALPLNMYNY